MKRFDEPAPMGTQLDECPQEPLQVDPVKQDDNYEVTGYPALNPDYFHEFYY